MRYRFARVSSSIFFFLSVTLAFPQQTTPTFRSVEALKSLGVRQCLEAMNAVAEYVHETSEVAYINVWNKLAPDKHMTTTILSKSFADGTGLMTTAVSPTPAGNCDAHVVQIFPVTDSCAKVRETSFKEWKYFTDLGTTPSYDDPTSDSVTAVFLSIQGGGCLIVKTGLLFFPGPTAPSADKKPTPSKGPF